MFDICRFEDKMTMIDHIVETLGRRFSSDEIESRAQWDTCSYVTINQTGISMTILHVDYFCNPYEIDFKARPCDLRKKFH